MKQWKWLLVNLLLILGILMLGFQEANAQGENPGVELSPYKAQQGPNSTDVAPFDLQFSFDATAASGAGGNAGAEFDGTYYYSTRWASNLIHKYDMTGTLVEQFSISGVTDLRDLAFDGTYMYGGNALNTIYKMDFVAKTLVGTITGLPVAVRHISYDPDADGFWIGTWATDITLVSRTGATLDVITGHGLEGMYGSAHDKWTAGGPYLWVFDQGEGADSPQLVHQFDISTGAATGVTYDVGGDLVSTGDVAGGLFSTEGIVPGIASLGGLLQGTPNWFFVYELAPTSGLSVKVTLSPQSGDGSFEYTLEVANTRTTSLTVDIWTELVDPHGARKEGKVKTGRVLRGHRLYRETGASTLKENAPPGDYMFVANVGTYPDSIVATGRGVFSKTSLSKGEALPGEPSRDAVGLFHNYPDPFNPSTTIRYHLGEDEHVTIRVFDTSGQLVTTLVDKAQRAGQWSVVWNGTNDAGSSVSSGIYIYRMTAGGFSDTKRMLLLK